MGNKYRCPCCGYFTLDEKPTNKFDICPVCFWEDDGIQLSNPNRRGGANDVSLNEARENFRNFGASKERILKYVRKPNEDELTGIEWDTPELI